MQYYHTHTSFSNCFTSFKDSHMMYEDYAKRALEVGCRILSSVEHGFQGNYLKCWETAKEFGLKFVYGTEAYWVEDRHQPDRTNAHIILLARNIHGIHQINEILSTANEDGFYYVPRVDPELLLKLDPANVMVTTACVSFWAKLKRGDNPSADPALEYHDGMMTTFEKLAKHFGSSLYLEVQAHNTPWQRDINKVCRTLKRRFGLQLIAGTDSHYILPEQIEDRRMLREESGTHIELDHEDDPNVFEDYPDEDTFRKRLVAQGVLSDEDIEEAIRNTDLILSFDDIEFNMARKIPTIHPDLTMEQRNQLYLDRVWSAWEKMKPSLMKNAWRLYDYWSKHGCTEDELLPPDEQRYIDAINYETQVITSTGTADYFLLDSSMVELGRQKGGYLTPTGRGSGSSFFTNTLLGLSTIDRLALPVRLYPDRFVTAERLQSSCPDLDLNVDRQEPFAEAQEELLGKGHSYQMIAYGTQKTKAAFKMYARAINMDAKIANQITQQIDHYEREVSFADDDDKDDILLEDFVEEQYLPYIEASEKYRSIIVNKSPAPCGFLIYNGDIRSEIGIMRINSAAKKKSVFCTVIDGATAEHFGYVKNDILVVKVCAINRAAMEYANIPLLSSSEIIERTLEDKETWDILAKGYTQGINQCQKDRTTQRLRQYQPRELRDMSSFVAAIRPGFKSQLSSFLARSAFSYGVPSFDMILHNDSSKSAWMLYQENTMTALSLAGFELSRTYPIIKAISKKKTKVIASAKEEFLAGFTKYLLSSGEIAESAAKEQSEAVWQVIEDSASYSFNACVSGTTMIQLVSKKNKELRVLSVAQMYDIKHNPDKYRSESEYGDFITKFAKRKNYGYTYSMREDGSFFINRIVDIRKAGVRTTYQVLYAIPEGNCVMYSAIRCTDNHKFPTASGIKKCSDLVPGDVLFFKKYHADTAMRVEVVSIKPEKVEMTYDVEMADPAHNFVADYGIVTCNSHAVCVSIDALYGAYLKAHYPYAYYKALLDDCAASKSNGKKKAALIRQEMLDAFGIRSAPCRFRQDNRSFRFIPEEKAAVNALATIKDVSQNVANILYGLRNKQFASFVEVLLEFDGISGITKKNIDPLIETGYFSEFGSAKKLMKVANAFREGKIKYDKKYVDATKAKRLAALRAYEKSLPDENYTPKEINQRELAYYGAPMSVDDSCTGNYMVVELAETKTHFVAMMFNMRKGSSGKMKFSKTLFREKEFSPGDVIELAKWHPAPVYSYEKGERVKTGLSEVVVDNYVIV